LNVDEIDTRTGKMRTERNYILMRVLNNNKEETIPERWERERVR